MAKAVTGLYQTMSEVNRRSIEGTLERSTTEQVAVVDGSWAFLHASQASDLRRRVAAGKMPDESIMAGVNIDYSRDGRLLTAEYMFMSGLQHVRVARERYDSDPFTAAQFRYALPPRGVYPALLSLSLGEMTQDGFQQSAGFDMDQYGLIATAAHYFDPMIATTVRESDTIVLNVDTYDPSV